MWVGSGRMAVGALPQTIVLVAGDVAQAAWLLECCPQTIVLVAGDVAQAAWPQGRAPAPAPRRWGDSPRPQILGCLLHSAWRACLRCAIGRAAAGQFIMPLLCSQGHEHEHIAVRVVGKPVWGCLHEVAAPFKNYLPSLQNPNEWRAVRASLDSVAISVPRIARGSGISLRTKTSFST